MLSLWQKNKFLTIILIISLALNVFMGAQILGHNARQRMMMGRLTERQIERLVSVAPEAKQDKLRKKLEANMATIQKDLDTLHIERQNLANLMTAEKFDEDAIQKQFALLRVRMNYLQKHLQQQTVDMLRELSVEERMKAVNAMQPPKLWRPKAPEKKDAGQKADAGKSK